jgi:hypothetical protein
VSIEIEAHMEAWHMAREAFSQHKQDHAFEVQTLRLQPFLVLCFVFLAPCSVFPFFSLCLLVEPVSVCVFVCVYLSVCVCVWHTRETRGSRQRKRCLNAA